MIRGDTAPPFPHSDEEEEPSDTGRLAETAAAADIVIDTASADHADSTNALLDALAGTGKT